MREFTIHTRYDEAARVWWGSNEQLLLITEAPTLDQLFDRVVAIAPEIAVESSLIAGGEAVRIRLVAHGSAIIDSGLT